ncbi:MAG: APC family permease [Candidatus Sericytochromatia bacterium]|nr:APC family permease [Candidatus Sericytochromatia bacterium]
MITEEPPKAPIHVAGTLQRTVGFGGLLFMSLGSIIGSGWLLGALNAAQAAGPASILSWILAAGMLSLLALTFAELGAAYPVAGGGGRFPYYSHGPVAGFVAGWASWLQAVFIAPIEVLACITYVNSVDWVNRNFNMITREGPNAGLLNETGLIVAVVMLLLFTAINLASVKVVSESNSLVVIWKTLVPVLAVVCLPFIAFHPENFTAGGGFMPFGFHGVFAALTGGVVFALQGFEQAVQLAGEARNPRRDLSRAVLTAMAIGAVLYAALQFTMLGLLEPANVKDGWSHPLGTDPSAYGAWYTLALALGAGWLAKALLIDAVVSPAGTGIVYITTTARLSYALGEEREMPSALTRTNSKGVPVVSILLAAGVGLLALGPFKSWNALVSVATGSTAIMYAFAPIALAALRKVDPDRKRSYRVPMPGFVLPGAFCSANLIMYWGGFGLTWKLTLAMLAGLVLFGIGAWVRRTGAWTSLRHAVWIPGWLGGQVLLGYLGRYGEGAQSLLPAWVDLGAVIVFSVGIFHWAVACAQPPERAREAVQKDAPQLEGAPELE